MKVPFQVTQHQGGTAKDILHWENLEGGGPPLEQQGNTTPLHVAYAYTRYRRFSYDIVPTFLNFVLDRHIKWLKTIVGAKPNRYVVIYTYSILY